MKRLIRAAGLLAILIALSPSLSAQWPKYPTPGVPRTASGEPIRDAPAPRTADGKPDLSGIWMRFRGEGGGANATAIPVPPGTPPVATFFDIGVSDRYFDDVENV